MPETASLDPPEQKQTAPPATLDTPIGVIEPPTTVSENSDQDAKRSAVHITVENIGTIDTAAPGSDNDISVNVNTDPKPESKQCNPEKESKDLDLCDWQPDDSRPVPSWRPWPFHRAFFAFLMIIHGLQGFIILIIWRKHYSAEHTGYDTETFIQTRLNPPDQFKFEDQSGPFFLWQFLPVAFAVCIGLLWTTVDVAARRLEPFYQISLPNGARAKDSISEDYMSSWLFLLPIKAGTRGHWSVAISSLIVIFTTTVLPALHGAMWRISWVCRDYYSSYSCSSGYYGIIREMNVAVIFAAIVVHSILIILAGHLASMVCHRKSGLINDPGGVTALASLICDSPRMLDLLGTIPSYSSQNNINYYLQPYRFKLRYLSCRSTRCGDHIKEAYQIVPILDEELDPTQRSEATCLQEFKFDRHEAHPISLRGPSMLAVECILAVPVMIVLLASHAETPRDWSIVDIKALFTFGWTVVISFYELVERDLRIMQPYYQAQLQARTVIFNQGWIGEFQSPAPLVSFFAFMGSDASILAWVSFRNFANQILVIFSPTLLVVFWDLLYEHGLGAEVPKVLVAAATVLPWFVYPVSFIGIIICFVLLAKRRKPILPRKPDTISSNLVYICMSRDLLNDLRGMSLLETEEFRSKCRERGKQPNRENVDAIGWFKDQRNEPEHWRMGWNDTFLRMGFAKKSKVIRPFEYGEPFDCNEC